ncbi:MAG: hypothetical protein A3B34_00130 [Candidatus Sungbacteria bacterium RIFCSPLOWO2_01_FULL_54_21]|uniref:Acylneuraminate cytidylyltransferase n=1 Tax=Candidatus Sungbacteria bacterium RIFCSPLOWO2_01_FULL_54_21 TaxID=1802279 RepID=A0A1G2L8A2_9BACT|nr:MAG: hypothetical protein A3B34_00130 [Candidatus Sungbacteria bacterium RIFCSPLOWO2_01_FULL_54_21]
MEILGIIPARGGSKSIPMKNLALLAGKPLLAYACSAAAASRRITRVIVSTDDEKIAATARACGADVPFMRPAELAADDTPALPVILHALNHLEKEEQYAPDIVVYLQPTSPLRRAGDIDGAIAALEQSGADSAVCVVEVPHQFGPASVMVMEGGMLKPYETGPHVLRRQDKQKIYARNGPAVLAIKRATLMEKNSLYGDTIVPYIMPPEYSLDIDTPLDLELAEFLLKKRGA